MTLSLPPADDAGTLHVLTHTQVNGRSIEVSWGDLYYAVAIQLFENAQVPLPQVGDSVRVWEDGSVLRGLAVGDTVVFFRTLDDHRQHLRHMYVESITNDINAAFRRYLVWGGDPGDSTHYHLIQNTDNPDDATATYDTYLGTYIGFPVIIITAYMPLRIGDGRTDLAERQVGAAVGDAVEALGRYQVWRRAGVRSMQCVLLKHTDDPAEAAGTRDEHLWEGHDVIITHAVALDTEAGRTGVRSADPPAG